MLNEMRHGVDSNTSLNIGLKVGFYKTHSVADMLPHNKKKLRGKDEKKNSFWFIELNNS